MISFMSTFNDVDAERPNITLDRIATAIWDDKSPWESSGSLVIRRIPKILDRPRGRRH